jgi:plastocyanin
VHAGDTIMWRNAGNQTHDVHLTPVTAASVDNGSFEATVLVGLGVTLVAIFAISRRT